MIHHYTSIENLALILKTGKLRFNRLDKVDHVEEIGIIDPRVYMKFFISCWTDDNNESIPLWKMYTPNMRGVRISMPEDMFQKKVIKAGKYKNAEVLHDLYSPFSFEELVNEDYMIGNTPALLLMLLNGKVSMGAQEEIEVERLMAAELRVEYGISK